MGRIVWNHNEKSAMFNEMVELLIEEPHMHPRDVLSRCQTTLPVNRRRDVNYNMIFNYKNTVVKAEAEANKQRPKRSALKVEEKLKLVETTDIVDQLMRKFAKLVADEIIKSYPTPFYLQSPGKKTESIERINIPSEDITTPVKLNSPGILIIGLNGHQMSVVKARFPAKDIMFLHADDATSHNPIRRDHTILMTKFINHSVHTRYRHAPNLQYCNGGLSELNSLLINIR